MKKYIDRALLAIGVAIVVGAIVLSINFLFFVPRLQDVTTLQYDGVTYSCLHYSNGDMKCSDINDPEVGGGHAQP